MWTRTRFKGRRGQSMTEYIIIVALIAIARKVITLDLKAYDSLTLIGIAAMILAIAGAFFLMKRCYLFK